MELSAKQIKDFGCAMEHHKEELHLLMLKYHAALMREKELNELFDSVYDEVLSENEYYVTGYNKPDRFDLKAGDRITSHITTFLMSDEDYEKFLKLAGEKMYNRGYTDENGTYEAGYDGAQMRISAENELINFQLSILPENLRTKLKGMKTYTARQKFLNLIMKQQQ